MNHPTTASVSVRFAEAMKGFVAFGERDYQRGTVAGRESGTSLTVHLTIEVEDLDRFEADPRSQATARGWIACDALGGTFTIERGAFNLFVDGARPEEKRMLYRLFFRDGVGHPVTLAGFKVMGSASAPRVWRDTSTLNVRLLRGHVEAADDPDAEIVASGILRLRPFDFLMQLTTFRATGPALADRIAAVGRFDALFLGQLWKIYGPGTVRLATRIRSLKDARGKG